MSKMADVEIALEERKNSCEECEVRKWIAHDFDLHWIGAEDCPTACKEKERVQNRVHF